MTLRVSFAAFTRSFLSRVPVLLVLMLPWLNPWASGPSPQVMPWLVTLICLAVVLGAISLGRAMWIPLIALAWLLAALLSSAMGLMQYIGVSKVWGPWVSGAALGEAFANLRQRNQFASLTSIGLLAVLWWAAQANAMGMSRMRSWGLVLATVLLTVGSVASSSRTGLLQLGLIVAMSWWWSRQSTNASSRWVHRLLFVAVGSYLLAALLLPVFVGQALGSGIFARLQNGGPACSNRMVLWSNVVQLISQKPWLGWGWDELRYAHFIRLYEGPRFCEIMGNAHNLPLHLAVTLGIPAALLLCGSGVWLVWRAKPWRETDATRQMAWGVLAVIGLHSLLEYPLWYGPFQMTVGLCLILLWVTRAQRSGSVTQASWSQFIPNRPAIQTTCAWVALFLISLVGYAAWDYHRVSQIYVPQAQRSAVYKDHTLEKIRSSWLFQNQVQFATLMLTPLTQDNAEQLNALAHELLHYTPEARVVGKLIDSARLLGREDEARFFALRYRAAYPEAYARSGL
jgi:O-antigen ligase